MRGEVRGEVRGVCGVEGHAVRRSSANLVVLLLHGAGEGLFDELAHRILEVFVRNAWGGRGGWMRG